jgi:hypothetical protein
MYMGEELTKDGLWCLFKTMSAWLGWTYCSAWFWVRISQKINSQKKKKLFWGGPWVRWRYSRCWGAGGIRVSSSSSPTHPALLLTGDQMNHLTLSGGPIEMPGAQKHSVLQLLCEPLAGVPLWCLHKLSFSRWRLQMLSLKYHFAGIPLQTLKVPSLYGNSHDP